jgi:hypothetical protein
MCSIDETPPSWPSNIFNPAVLDPAKPRRYDWVADYRELHFGRLFYGTSKTRWKILEGNNRLVGPHGRLYLARSYADAEFTAFQAVARDIYYGELLRAADFEVPNGDFEAAAAGYVLSDTELLFDKLEEQLEESEVSQLAEEACKKADYVCSHTKKLSEAENAGVIAIIDVPGLVTLEYRLSPDKPHEDESDGVEFAGPIEPLDVVLLGTAIARFSSLPGNAIGWPPGPFWCQRFEGNEEGYYERAA